MSGASSSNPTYSTRITSIQRQYTAYIQNGGDGDTVLLERSEKLGYDGRFLTSCKINANATKNNTSSDINKIFVASCGPGCPLKLPGSPKEGDVVVDLGCGAGHDVLLARRIVGKEGRVIGVDVTSAMLEAARNNVQIFLDDEEANNIDFVEGPLDDPNFVMEELEAGIANVVISNGVFNLCESKREAFYTAYKLLKPGGRFLLSDLCRVPNNPNAVLVNDCAVCSS